MGTTRVFLLGDPVAKLNSKQGCQRDRALSALSSRNAS